MRVRPVSALPAAALALVIGVLSTPALASHPEASLDFACASDADGALRYVTDLAECDPSTEAAIAIRPGPTVLCVLPDGSAAPAEPTPTPGLPDTAMPAPGTLAPPSGFLDTLLVTPGDCGPPGTVLTLPSATDEYFCADDATGLLRHVSDPSECTSSETPLVAANHSPTGMALSDTSVAENEPVGTAVGTLSAADPDLAESFTFALVSGAGDADNAAFEIDGTTLRTAAVFDFETSSLVAALLGSEASTFGITGIGSLSIRVSVTDAVGATREESFAITIDDTNDVPTDITLTPSSIVENSPVGSTVGTLAAVDQDTGQSHTFALVAGAGDTDNASFTIVGSELQLAASLPIGSYSVRIQADDGAGGTFVRAMTVTITDVNDAPTDIALSAATVAENEPAGTAVGVLSATDADLPAQTFTFALAASGCGGGPFPDNASFDVMAGELVTAASLDFETQASFTICVRVTDSGSPALSFDESFTITVTDTNDAPTAIALTSSSVAENEPAGTAVGTLSATDQDILDTHTFSLVAGAGDADNASFQISGTTLETSGPLDFEADATLSIRVEADDGNGGTFQQSLAITVTDANDAPTDIALSNASVAENEPVGTTVGTLSATDQDAGDTHAFSLVAGAGDADNASFQISGTTLETAAAFDFETKDSYTIRVEVDDGNGGTFEESFTISITDVNDAPTDIALSSASVAENESTGTTVGTLSATDQDVLDSHTFSLVAGTGDTDNGSFQISGSTLKTSGPLDFEAGSTLSIRVQADDGNGGTFEEVFTVTVIDVNDPPSFELPADPDQTVLEDAGPQTVAAFATSISAGGEIGQTLTFTLTPLSPGLFSVQPDIDETTGDLTYTPAANANGTITLSVTLSDDGGGTDTSPAQTFDITITAVNDAPSFSLPADPDQTAPQDAGPQMVAGFATAISAGPSDEVAQNVTFGLTTTNDALFATLPSIDEATGDLTYEAVAGTSGSATVSVVLTDDGGTADSGDDASATQSFDITVTPPNATPVAVGASVSTDEDTALVITLTATDGDDDALTFTIVDDPTQGSLGPVGALDCSAVDSCTASVTYTPDPDSNGADSFTFSVNDGQVDSNVGAITITINPVNDAPVLTLSGSAPSYTEGGSAATVDGGLTITDIDSSNLVSGTVSITAGGVTGDTLTFTPAGGITDTNAAPDVLALTGTTSLVNWQTVLRSVQFSSTSDNPTNVTRAVSFTVNDGGLASNTVQKSVAVVPVNDAPALVQPDAGAVAYTEGDAATVIAPSITATDPDSTNLVGATITIAIGYANGQDVLSLGTNPQNGITAAAFNAATGTLTLSGTSSVANYQTALRDVRFANTSQDPTAGTRTITFQATDGSDLSNLVSRGVTVIPVNDPPVAGDLTFSGANAAIGNTALVINDASDGAPNPTGPEKTVAGDLLAAGTDVDTPAGLWTITATTVSNAAGSLTIEADGDLTYHPTAGFSGNAVFTYTLNDNDPDGNAIDTGTITINVPAPMVWFVDNTAAAGGDGTSDGPFDALADVSPAGPDAAGDIIYLFTGSGAYTGGITLLNTQTLQGAGTALVVSGTTLATAGTDPTITNAAGNGVTLGSGNTLTGFTVGNTTGFDIANTATATVGSLTVTNVVLNGSGSLFRADSGGALAVTLESATTSAAGASGIVIAGGATGSFTVSGVTTINDATADGIAISNSAANATFTGLVTILNDGAGANGDGVDLSTNTGTYAFSGGVSITVNGTGAFGFRAQSSGTVTIADPGGTNQITSNNGTAILINPTSLTATLATVTSSGGSEGISLSGMSGALTIGSVDIDGQTGDGLDITSSAGSVTINGGTIGATNDPAGIGVDINGGTGNVTITATITKTTAGDVVEVSGRTAGTVDFNGAITSSTAGGGIDLTGNTGATIRFDGGMALSTGAAAAFNATGGGTVIATQNNTTIVNTLITTTGTALNVANTTIGTGGLTFRSIAANGGANGILLNTTGAVAGLTVTGNGGICTAAIPTCTGGTIQNTTGADNSGATPPGTGVVLNNTQQVSLTNMRIRQHPNYGIRGDDITGFSFANGLIDGVNGTNVATPFNDGSINLDRVVGTIAITGSDISGGFQRNIKIDHPATDASATATITIAGNTIHDTSAAFGDDGIGIEAENSDNYTINVSNNAFARHGGDHINVTMINSAVVDVTISGNTLAGGHPVGLGQGIIVFGANWNGSGMYDVLNNTINGNKQGGSIHMNKGSGTATMSGTISGNVIGTAGVVGSGSEQAFGIIVGSRGAGGAHTTLISDNTIRQYFDRGIVLQAGEGSSTLNATVTGNTVDEFADTVNSLHGIHLDFGILAADNGTVCADIGGGTSGLRNHVTNAGNEPAGGVDIRLRRGSAVSLQLRGYAGGSEDDAAVTTYLLGRNDATTVSVTSPGSGTTTNTPGGGPCPLP